MSCFSVRRHTKTKKNISAASSYFSCTKQYVMLLNVANSYLSLYFIIIINTLFVVLIINNFLLRKLFESRKTPIFFAKHSNHHCFVYNFKSKKITFFSVVIYLLWLIKWKSCTFTGNRLCLS